jgi:hypothetical protein
MRIIHVVRQHKRAPIVAAALLCAALLVPLLAMNPAEETAFAPPVLDISVAPAEGTALPEGAELTAVPLPVEEGGRVIPGGVAGDSDFLYDTLVSGDVTVLEVAPAAQKIGGG